MIPGKPAEGAIQTGGVEQPHLTAGGAQTRPELATDPGADPVAQDANLHPLPRALLERVREGPPDLVIGKDVALEEDVATGGGDGLEPGRVVLGCVPQQPHPVAQHQRCSRGARQRLLRKPPLHELAPGLRTRPEAKKPTHTHPATLARSGNCGGQRLAICRVRGTGRRATDCCPACARSERVVSVRRHLACPGRRPRSAVTRFCRDTLATTRARESRPERRARACQPKNRRFPRSRLVRPLLLCGPTSSAWPSSAWPS